MRRISIFMGTLMFCSPLFGVTQKGEELTLTCKTGQLVFSTEDGRILRLTDAKGTVLAGPSHGGNLWSVEPGINERNFGTWGADPPVGRLKRIIPGSLFQRERKTFSWSWDDAKKVLTLKYESEYQPVRVKVEVTTIDDGFRFVPWISVDGPQSVDFQIPRLVVDYKTIERFHVPNDFAVALTPKFFQEGRSFSLRYPVAFSDMMFWTRQDKAGPVAIYRSEAEETFMPSSATVIGGGADPDASRLPCMFYRTYHFYTKDKSWVRCPQFDLTVGTDLRTMGRRYGELRQLGPKLSEKLPKELYEKLIRSVIIKYGSSTMAGAAAAAGNDFDNQRKNLHRFPSPSIIHIVSYLCYGFDRGYPNFLPPAGSGGGPQPFAALIEEIHKQGKLWMPHTNPTFWNIEPKDTNRTPFKHGTDPFLKDRYGKFCYNGGTYESTAGGRMVSPMHPTVVKVQQEAMTEFAKQWKTDLVFCDQLANRWGDMDYNKTTGYPPHGYVQQLTDLASRLKTIVPLAMEGGFDWQVPNATVFHSLSWPMAGDPANETDYNSRYGKGCWEWSPMFMYVAHDRVMTSLHNLGDKVENAQRLSTLLVHGYTIMSNIGDGDCDTLKDDGPELRWLWWLSAVQKNICARYLGQELLQFRYLDKYVIETKYPNLRLITNLTGTPYELKNEKVTLAPYGYLVTSDDGALQAGHVTVAYGRSYTSPVSFIRNVNQGKVEVWLHAEKPGTVTLLDAANALKDWPIPTSPQREPLNPVTGR